MKLRNAGLGKNSEFTKRLNRQMVLDLLRREPTQSRADLARLTRLSPQSLSNMIDDLQRAGLIEASGKIYGGKGQPPTNYRIAADRGYGIGLHVDRDFIRAALVDFDFVQRFGMRRPLTARSVDGVKDILTDMINELIAAAAVPVDRIWGSASPPRDFAMPMYWTLQASKGRSGANCTAMRSIGALPKRGTWPSSSRTTPTPAPWLN